MTIVHASPTKFLTIHVFLAITLPTKWSKKSAGSAKKIHKIVLKICLPLRFKPLNREDVTCDVRRFCA